MSKPFAEYDYDDAALHFGRKAVTGTVSLVTDLNLRRPSSAIAATAFFQGDAWQNGTGFIGQFPPASFPGQAQIVLDIKKRFEAENVIKQVVELHLGGLLGREPLWGMLKEVTGTQEKKTEKDEITGEVLTSWWNERKGLKDLSEAAETALLEGRATKRLFFPRGILPDGGTLTASNLNKALDFIFFETLKSDVAGVFTDPDTQKQVGIYLFTEKDADGNEEDQCAELSFLDENGDTVGRVVKDKGEPEDFGPFKLGGQLLIHEIERSPLITEEVQSNQKALNLAHTMMTRNVNLAGSRERTVINAQDPKAARITQDPNNSSQVITTEPSPYVTGASAVMFLMGYPIYNQDGNVIGYTPPSLEITDPASVEVFVNTRRMKYEAILAQCHQLHVLISGDATASGVSRKQAEKSFQRSLKETKTVIDAAGRWEIETTLRLAAQICGQSEKYSGLRADFNCLLDTGEPEPDERRVAVEMRDANLISNETARNWIGIDDAAAELKRIEGEKVTEPTEPKPQELTGNEGEGVELIA